MPMLSRYIQMWIAVITALSCAVVSASSHITLPVEQTGVVKVQLEGGSGSGIHLGNGFILTANHVVDGEKSFQAVSPDGSVMSANLVWVDAKHDLAMLVTPQVALKSKASLNCDVDPKVGDEIMGVGNPLDVLFAETWGRVSAPVEKRLGWEKAFVVDMTIGPGMSGGPVFGADGRVVGIMVAIYTKQVGLGIAVPAKSACDLIDNPPNKSAP